MTEKFQTRKQSSKKWNHGIHPIFILFCVLALSEERFICKHFDPSVDVGSRYYETDSTLDYGFYRQVHGLNATMIIKRLNDNEIIQPIVNNSCIGSVTAWKSKKINNFALD